MKKHIIIKASTCANAQEIAHQISCKFGLKAINLAEEFHRFTGDSEGSYASSLELSAFHKVYKQVIRRTRLKLIRQSVILVSCSSLSSKDLSELGFVYNLDQNDNDTSEMAEYIFDKAAEHYYSDERLQYVVA